MKKIIKLSLERKELTKVINVLRLIALTFSIFSYIGSLSRLYSYLLSAYIISFIYIYYKEFKKILLIWRIFYIISSNLSSILFIILDIFFINGLLYFWYAITEAPPSAINIMVFAIFNSITSLEEVVYNFLYTLLLFSFF